jgi:hypothetical protein
VCAVDCLVVLPWCHHYQNRSDRQATGGGADSLLTLLLLLHVEDDVFSWPGGESHGTQPCLVTSRDLYAFS